MITGAGRQTRQLKILKAMPWHKLRRRAFCPKLSKTKSAKWFLIPKGFRLKAQGCEERATLGEAWISSFNLE